MNTRAPEHRDSRDYQRVGEPAVGSVEPMSRRLIPLTPSTKAGFTKMAYWRRDSFANYHISLFARG